MCISLPLSWSTFLSRCLATSLSIGTAVGLSGCASTPASNDKSTSTSESIAWQQWDAAAFSEAKSQNKMVLVDIGIEGCTACRWMDEDTYKNDKVVSLVNANFVTIQVDAEARPDLGERYSNWAWPATIFLTPDGEQVLALRGNKRPRNFLPILQTLIDKKREGTLDGDVAAALPPPTVATSEFSTIQKRVNAQLDRSFAASGTGWNKKMVHTLPERLEHEFVRAKIRGDAALLERALGVTEVRASLLDPEWGGIFVAGMQPKIADNFIPEKRTRYQAGAIDTFATAYQLTGEQRWMQYALNVDKYLRGMMRGDDGLFYTTQEDDAPSLPNSMSARGYYRLKDAERRRYGIPPIDHATYTDRNAAVIRAYLSLYRASGDSQYRDVATQAADAILKERMQEQGWVAQAGTLSFDDKRMRKLEAKPRMFLRTQAYFGLALVDLAEATRDSKYIAHAEGIAKALSTIEDDVGGFFASDSPAGLGPRMKPLEDNATAARFLWRLGHFSGDKKRSEQGLRTLRAVTSKRQVKAEGKAIGLTATALEIMSKEPLKFVIVAADHNDENAKALWEASLRLYEPRRVLRTELPGETYPDRGQSTLYICTTEACSVPIQDASLVKKEAARFSSR